MFGDQNVDGIEGGMEAEVGEIEAGIQRDQRALKEVQKREQLARQKLRR